MNKRKSYSRQVQQLFQACLEELDQTPDSEILDGESPADVEARALQRLASAAREAMLRGPVEGERAAKTVNALRTRGHVPAERTGKPAGKRAQKYSVYRRVQSARDGTGLRK